MHWEGRKNVMVHGSFTKHPPSQGFHMERGLGDSRLVGDKVNPTCVLPRSEHFFVWATLLHVYYHTAKVTICAPFILDESISIIYLHYLKNNNVSLRELQMLFNLLYNVLLLEVMGVTNTRLILLEICKVCA